MAYRLPSGGRGVAGHAAPDAVVVERAHAGRQPGGAIEHAYERLIGRAMVDRERTLLTANEPGAL
jgi:hypothetical protein